MKWITAICLILLMSPACVKEQPLCCALPPVEMTKALTQCADPWGYGANDTETTALFASWLKQKNIISTKTEIVGGGVQEVCLACPCKSGKIANVWVPQQNIDSLKSFGFTVK